MQQAELYDSLSGPASWRDFQPREPKDEFERLDRLGLLGPLLQDRTTRQPLVWATESYSSLGKGYQARDCLSPALLVRREEELLALRKGKVGERTRKHGEVFTPFKICKQMCDFAHAELAGLPWREYVSARVLEITCGQAPFLASRVDLSDGRQIPLYERCGLLDRKLKLVCVNAGSEEQWLAWAFRALQATYGYEFQGDNLLYARMNILRAFEEYLEARWQREPTREEYKRAVETIAWNIWQMDGLKGVPPFTAPPRKGPLSLLGQDAGSGPCRIRDWQKSRLYEFPALSGENSMKFDFIIGNPPYQDESLGDQKTYLPPVYNSFIDGAYEIADNVELIHPARFLSNAGSTPKEWNRKMLSNPDFKILKYTPDSSEYFENTEIKGGIAISYYSKGKNYGPIEIFTPIPRLGSILKKVIEDTKFVSFSTIVLTSYAYHFTESLYQDFPELKGRLSAGHNYDLKSHVLSTLSEVFLPDIEGQNESYIQILGRIGNERCLRYIKRKYINDVWNLDSWKIFVPGASNSGQFGETLASPLIGEPKVGSTETFLSIGKCKTKQQSENILKFIKTKFARTLLGILKKTQALTPEKWKYVPLQDFTENSDIDWSKSIPEIDRQLYAKYELDEKEIGFIETHVREMN